MRSLSVKLVFEVGSVEFFPFVFSVTTLFQLATFVSQLCTSWQHLLVAMNIGEQSCAPAKLNELLSSAVHTIKLRNQ